MCKSAIAIRERLAKANPQAYEPDLADSYNNLAIVYYCTERIQECEELFKATLAIRERLAKANLQIYGPALADSYSNLAILYNEPQRFAESEEMANAAAEIRERLGIESATRHHNFGSKCLQAIKRLISVLRHAV